jgi:4-carboxymuconolactone decarboxylase
MVNRSVFWKTVSAICAVGLMAFLVSTRGNAQQDASQQRKGVRVARFSKDIDPQSGFRLPDPKREDMDAQGQKLYDTLIGTNKARLWSPFGIQFYSPKFQAIQRELNQYLRSDEAGIPPDIRELAILVACRADNIQYEWSAHEPLGLKAGLDQRTIDVVKYRRSSAGLRKDRAIVIQLGREMYGQKKVSSATFARALKAFGPKTLVNIVGLMGFYYANGGMLQTFDLQMPPGRKPLLPIP